MFNIYQNDTINKHAAVAARIHTVTATEDTASSAAIAIDDLPVVNAVLSVQIASAGNVRRAPQGAVTISGNTVTVADSGLAEDETIILIVAGNQAL